jgi:hypothetical protein
MKLSTILWVIVPGVGQIHLGRAGKGILFFTLFALFLNGWLLMHVLPADRMIKATLLALTVLAWLISTVDYVRLAAEHEARQAQERSEP